MSLTDHLVKLETSVLQ